MGHIVGIGLDLVEVSRVGTSLARWGDRLVAKLMDPEEAGRLPVEPGARAARVARAIALKEAASKALGTGWSHGVAWRQVVVADDPLVRLTGRAAEVARLRGSSSGTVAATTEARGDLFVAEVWLLE